MGAVEPQHLDAYLNEFTFRFNRRRSQRRGLLIYRCSPTTPKRHPAPYKTIIGGNT